MQPSVRYRTDGSDRLVNTSRTETTNSGRCPAFPERPCVLTPDSLAVISDRCVAARLRGDRTLAIDVANSAADEHLWSWTIDVSLLCDWLARHWQPDGPAEPASYPQSVSFLGQHRTSSGPRWYAAGDKILGFIPGTARGCYVIPALSLIPGIVPAPSEDSLESWS
jgi:hypothetical protein